MKTVSKHPLFVGTAVLMFSVAGMYGCQNFLDDAAAPQGTLNSTSLANRAGVEGSLIAAYRSLDCNNATSADWGCAASNWVWGSAASDDAYKGSEASDQPPIDQIEEFHWDNADAQGYLNTKWRSMYEGVVRANATLRLLKSVLAAAPGEFDAASADNVEGQSLFLRAHYHFEAYRMWGNIPYYKEDDEDFRKANGDTTAALTAIIADLDAAIAKLPATQSDKGRVTSWTAKAYKGKVQMYAKDFAGAKTTLLDVKNNGPYALESSFDHVWTGFDALQNGPETILAYQASANDGEPNGNNANYGERLNFPHSGSPFGCCGFHQASQNIVNSFLVDVNGLPLALSDPVSANANGNWNASNANFVGGSAAAVDPRIDWTVGRDDVPYKDWGLHAPGWIRAPAYGGVYSPKKNVDEKASNAESSVGWVPTQLNNVNIHIYRYAEALLLLAEAEVEVNGAGDLAAAQAIVNSIRARAAVKVQGCGLPSDAKAAAAEVLKWPVCAGDTRMAVSMADPHPWANYQIGQYIAPWASQAVARAAVHMEEKLELAMEGQRFFNLRRYPASNGDDFKTVMNAYLAVEKTRRLQLANAETVIDKHRWFPIPEVQRELSKVGTTSKLTQNAGW
jgi:hypothetical protein